MRVVLGMLLLFSVGVDAQERTSENNKRLKDLLKRYPQADTNGDGVLTEKEVWAHLRKAAEERRQPGSGSGGTKNLPSAGSPTHANAKYDTKHARNVLDFWKAESDKPTPVFVWFHGGGFKAGDKSSFALRNNQLLRGFLKRGVSVASCNYPFLEDASYEEIMRHCARAIQFLRSKEKEWNIDTRRIGACGASAGALISEWIGYHPDIAKRSGGDPVEKLSSSLSVVGSHLQPMGTEVFALRYMKKGGPPLFIYTNARSSDSVHDPKYARMIKKKADELGIPAVLYGSNRNDIPPPPKGENWMDLQVEFFCKHFDMKEDKPAEKRGGLFKR